MVLNLGGIIFETRHNLSIELKGETGVKSNERINNNLAHFKTNLGKTNLNINGITIPYIDGNKKLKKLWNMCNKPITLTAGDGKYYGKFVLLEINETRSIFTNDGKFLAQEFSIKLEKYQP